MWKCRHEHWERCRQGMGSEGVHQDGNGCHGSRLHAARRCNTCPLAARGGEPIRVMPHLHKDMLEKEEGGQQVGRAARSSRTSWAELGKAIWAKHLCMDQQVGRAAPSSWKSRAEQGKAIWAKHLGMDQRLLLPGEDFCSERSVDVVGEASNLRQVRRWGRRDKVTEHGNHEHCHHWQGQTVAPPPPVTDRRPENAGPFGKHDAWLKMKSKQNIFFNVI